MFVFDASVNIIFGGHFFRLPNVGLPESELVLGLGAVEHINDFLLVHHSPAFTTLAHFSSLHHINGVELYQGR